MRWSQKPQIPGIDRVRGHEVDYLVLVKVRPGMQYGVARELRRRIKTASSKRTIIKAGTPAQIYIGQSPCPMMRLAFFRRPGKQNLEQFPS